MESSPSIKATNLRFEAARAGLGWSLLVVPLALFTLTETYNKWVPVGLAFLAAFAGWWITQAMAAKISGRPFGRIGLGWPAVLFLASAALAAYISYDRSLALLQFGRVAASVGLFLAVAGSPPGLRKWLAGGFVLAAAALAVYWPLEHDFAADPAKIAALQRVGLWIQDNLPRFKLAALTGPRIHSNVAAGVLLVAFPFSLALVWDLWRRRSSLHRFPWLALAALGLSGLILACLALTISRGALLGLVALGSMAVLVWMQRRWFGTPVPRLVFWSAVALAGLAFAGWLVSLWAPGATAGSVAAPIQTQNGAVLGRLELLPHGIQLARDYFFTGSGLRSFHLVYGIYSVMLDMVVDDHIHNTFLEIWIEQGLAGIIAVILGAIWLLRRFWHMLAERKTDPFAWAALAALFAASVHGLVDVVFYVERTLPLVGFIAGFATQAPAHFDETLNGVRQSNAGRSPRRLALNATSWLTLGIVVLVAALVFSQYRRLAGMAYANLGAIQQTRIEIAAFNAPDRGDTRLDQIRQNLDLTAAENSFQRALAYDSGNLTARQRLAMIYMSRRQYDSALEQMQAAWDAGRRDSLTRMLYSDVLVATGDSEAAADAIRGVTWGRDRLLGQAWYRYWIFDDFRRAADAWKTVLLIDPHNEPAAYWLQQANKKLGH